MYDDYGVLLPDKRLVNVRKEYIDLRGITRGIKDRLGRCGITRRLKKHRLKRSKNSLI